MRAPSTWAVTAVAASLLLVLAPGSSRAVGPDETLDAGWEALSEGRYKLATVRFGRALEADGSEAEEALVGLGRVALVTESYEEALARGRELRELGDGEAARARSALLIADARFGLALQAPAPDEDRSEGENPVDERPVWRLSDEARKHLEAAAQGYREALVRTGGRSGLARRGLAESLVRLGRLDEAAAVLEERPAGAPDGASEPFFEILEACIEWRRDAASGDAERPGVREVSGEDVERPERLTVPEAHYTEAARRAGVEGTVLLRAVVTDEGRVVCPHVIDPLPFGLSDAALLALSHQTFEPATADGEPLPVYYRQTVRFRLGKGWR